MRFCEAKGFLGGAGKLGARRPRPPGPAVNKEEPPPPPLHLTAGGSGGGRVREEGHMPRVCAEKRLHGM